MCELISLMLSGTAWVPEDVQRRPSPNEAQLGHGTLFHPDTIGTKTSIFLTERHNLKERKNILKPQTSKSCDSSSYSKKEEGKWMLGMLKVSDFRIPSQLHF